MPCNEAKAVRSTCLNGKKMAIKIENKNKKNIQIMALKKILYIAEKKLIMRTLPFF
jgi:hypothetical protein